MKNECRKGQKKIYTFAGSNVRLYELAIVAIEVNQVVEVYLDVSKK